eukprot:12418627-Karenia_brevis.AAC.1
MDDGSVPFQVFVFIRTTLKVSNSMNTSVSGANSCSWVWNLSKLSFQSVTWIDTVPAAHSKLITFAVLHESEP